MLKSSKTKNVINRSISVLINLPEYNIFILKAKHYFGKWRSYIFVPFCVLMYILSVSPLHICHAVISMRLEKVNVKSKMCT